MSLIRLNRLDAAGRLTDSAIRMTFDGADPVAIHAVIAEAHRIIHDFYRTRGDIESYLRLGDWIGPGHAARFWRYINASADFLKQSTWDSDALFDLEEDTNDFMIVYAARWYQKMGFEATRAMRVFATWYVACNPGILRADAMPEAKITAQLESMSKALQGLERTDRLRAGQMALQSVSKAAS